MSLMTTFKQLKLISKNKQIVLLINEWISELINNKLEFFYGYSVLSKYLFPTD